MDWVRMRGRSGQELAYWALAVVSGVIVGINVIPFPLDVIILLILGVSATLIRRRVAGADSLVTSIAWLAVFAVFWLPIAWLRHGYPFG